jgi:hypothetical protein
VRPDRGGDADGVARQVQRPALLDVEFDEGADAGEPLGVGPDGVRVVPGGLHRTGQRDAVGVAQLVRGLLRQLSGGEPGADAGEAEAGALLVAEVDDREGAPEADLAGAQFVEGGEGGDHAEGPVEGAAVGHGVQVRAGDDGVAGRRVAEPRPLVAVAVDLVLQAAGLGLHAEPEPAVRVGRGPGEAAVAAGGGAAADGRERPPHGVEGVAHAEPSSRIGTRTPFASATDSAVS